MLASEHRPAKPVMSDGRDMRHVPYKHKSVEGGTTYHSVGDHLINLSFHFLDPFAYFSKPCSYIRYSVHQQLLHVGVSCPAAGSSTLSTKLAAHGNRP